MMTTQLVRSTFGLALVLGVAATHLPARAGLCEKLFGTEAAQMKWRDSESHKSPDGSVAATSSRREKQIKASMHDMTNSILKNDATPLMDFFPEHGAKVNWLVQSAGYGTGQITKIEVSGLGASGVFRGSLLLPVSGHTGAANAKLWATTDTYKIWVEIEGQPRVELVADAPSLGVVTVQELAITLARGKKVTIYYDRSGSAGPGGFSEGRTLEIIWDGT